MSQYRGHFPMHELDPMDRHSLYYSEKKHSVCTEGKTINKPHTIFF